MRQAPRPVEYPLKRVFEIVDAPNVAALNQELTELVGSGQIRAVYRIRSRQTGAGIAEYTTLTEVPDRIYDETADIMQNVDLLRDVELIYRARQ